MRLTIVPADRFISIDDEGIWIYNEDLSWIPENIHAVQWYDTWGEIEYKDHMPANEIINELGIFQQAIVTHENEKNIVEQLKKLEEEEYEKNRDYLQELRNIRNQKLYESDWTQFTDSPLTEEEKESWRIYRQQLRDLPSIIEDPKSLVLDPNHSDWPVFQPSTAP